MIYVVGLKNETNIKSIFVNEIIFNDFSINDDFDACIFTSKNAVKSCVLNNINLKNKKIFSIGLATTKYLNSLGLDVFYTGKSAHASEFKNEILPLLNNLKCVYFRALNIISDLDEFLDSNNISLRSVIAYSNARLNTPLDKDLKPFVKSINNEDILIFLAPSGVRDYEYFFKTFPKNIIAIGKSTENELKKYNVKNIFVSDYPTLQDCLNLANSLNKV
ncbi:MULTISPECIES: uroporphyrinogen-III synthase [unclassified Campylobacter]|uniref:uroporphyrinogen-III synthase n=1 Tax=unclassified Campylobacter TaxID=2593542 RepID=UPI001D5AB20A|nr:uroporphyrinogen-III synthase [Campylobacter sp. RM9331]MBZ8005800.1 uroporphyrinogen-III synthase [Campylobacter sp. RM9332]